MSNEKIIRAWKDKAYRESLSSSEKAALPENPAGPVELTEEQLGSVLGGLDLADPGQVAATSWKPMCRETATWICDFYP